jgi:hypothetical protein
MFVAFDKNKNKIDIEHAEPNKVYYCTDCQQTLIQRRGTERVHHFAHKHKIDSVNRNCEFRKSYSHEISEWHRNWQKRFHTDCCEKLIYDGNGIKRIADVLVNKIVIEFQHSYISYSKFNERNEFYISQGYNVVWLFDIIKYIENDSIIQCTDKNGNGYYKWTLPPKFFRELNLINLRVGVYFQFSNSDGIKEKIIERVLSFYNNSDFFYFYTDTKNKLSPNEFVEYANKNTLFKTKYSNEYINKHGHTISDLWNKNYKLMVVENLLTGLTVTVYGRKEDGSLIEGKKNGSLVIRGKTYNSNKLKFIYDGKQPIWRRICFHKRKYYDYKKEK